MMLKKNIKLLIMCFFCALMIDQIAKFLIVHSMTPFQPPANVIGTLIRFKLTYNPYGVFSISFGPPFLYYILTALGIFVLTYVALTLKDKVGVVVFGFIIGGAIGNFIDRIRLHHVVDFIDMGIGGLRWFTYNPADAFITVGAIYLVLRELFIQKKTIETKPTEQKTTTTP
jgi:signal peptidase II